MNRHPEIVCGDELGLFSKPVIFDNYGHLKRWHFLIKRAGISSQPYFQERSILRNLDAYSLTQSQVWEFVLKSDKISELTDKLKAHVLTLTGKKVWAEKTPENIFTIGRFLKVFPDSRVIHIVRDPRDVILSLMARGRSFGRAAEKWLTSVAAIQNYRGDPRVLEITYEDLILEREKTLARVCSHLNVEFKIDFFATDAYKSKNIKKTLKFNAWRSEPTDDFSSKSIGKYKTSDVDFTDILSMSLTREFASVLSVEPLSLSELASGYGYQLVGMRSDDKKDLSRSVTDKEQNIILNLLDVIIEKNKYIQRVVY
jgi:hypothetical protein